MMKQTSLHRRGVLALAAGGVAITLVPLPASAQLAPAVQAAIDRVRGDRTPMEGRVTLRLPPIAENGNTVPLTVTVESPMSAADHVKTIHVFATRNPTPDLASFHLTPAMGREVLLIPSTAVIQTGTRNVVMAALGEGRFMPVEVELGLETNGQTEIRKGLEAGQKVIVSGQFLVDSEASLKGVETRMGDVPTMGKTPADSSQGMVK